MIYGAPVVRGWRAKSILGEGAGAYGAGYGTAENDS
jgi:hypothetical protein